LANLLQDLAVKPFETGIFYLQQDFLGSKKRDSALSYVADTGDTERMRQDGSSFFVAHPKRVWSSQNPQGARPDS
jgi:hypothetical protein